MRAMNILVKFPFCMIKRAIDSGGSVVFGVTSHLYWSNECVDLTFHHCSVMPLQDFLAR